MASSTPSYGLSFEDNPQYLIVEAEYSKKRLKSLRIENKNLRIALVVVETSNGAVWTMII